MTQPTVEMLIASKNNFKPRFPCKYIDKIRASLQCEGFVTSASDDLDDDGLGVSV